MARKIGELFFELRTSSEALSRDLKDGERQFGKFADFVKANPLVAVTGLGAAFLGLAFQAAQAAARIDTTFRQVSNTLGLAGREAESLRADMRDLAIETGESEEELAGLFRTIAAGGPGGAQNIKAIADGAIALAQATGGSSSDFAQGIDLITDIFAIDPSRGREVAASLFEIAKGRVPLNDVLDALSKIGPEAQALGLDFETTSAFLVRFLDQGFSVKRTSSLFKELAGNGAEGRAEIVRLAGAAIDLTRAMDGLDKAQQSAQTSTEALAKKVRNNLNVAWVDFGEIVTKVAGGSLALLIRYLEKSEAPVARLVSSLLGVRKALDEIAAENFGGKDPAALLGATRVTRPTVGPLQAGLGDNAGPLFKGLGPDPVETSKLLDTLGKRFADIQTATQKLEALSIGQLRDNQRALQAIIATPGVADEQVINAKELLGKIDEQIQASLAKSSASAKSAADDFRKAYNASLLGIASALAEVDREAQDALDELAKKQKTTRAELERDADVRDGATTSLRNQIEALIDGGDAYERLAIAQAQVAAVDAADAKAAEAKLSLSQQQIDDIRKQVVENARLKEVLEALQSLRGKNPFEIDANFDDVGQFADGLSRAASAAAGIATAFGEGGRALSAVVGQSAQLLTNLSRAQRSGITTGADGKQQNFGFLGALSGKAGAAGLASAASSVLGVVGAVSAVADALDLFGSRSRERARQMREAAVAFNQALDDFLITSRTSLEEQLRANLRSANDLVKQAAAASGVKLSGVDLKSADDIDAIIADKLRNTTKVLQPAFAAYIAELEKVADAIRANEATLREANRVEVARQTEQLEVRRLAAAGLTELSAVEAERLARLEAIRAAEAKFGKDSPYLDALKEIQLAELAAAEATRARAAVLRQLDDDNALVGGTAAQRIQRTIAALVQSFPDLFAGAFDGLDFSTSDGLARAKEIIKGFYNQLAVDGVSDAERPIVDFLKRLFGDIDSAIGNLPDVLDPLARELEGFGERVQVFGLSLTEQLRELKTIFAGKFGETFDEILKNADLGTATGRAEFKNRLQQQISGILADGVITDAERPYYDALLRFLGLVNDALDDASAEAEQAITDAATARERSRGRAGNRVALFDLEGLDAFEAILDGYGAAFSGLFDTFDLSSLAGVEAAKEVLRGIFTELDGLSDAEIFARFGLTRDELLAALLDTDSGLDSLASSLGDVAGAALAAAQAASDFAESVNNDYLRSTGNGQAADMNAAKSRRDARIKQAVQLGLGQAVIDQIEGIYQADITEIAGRYADKTSATAASTPAATSAARASTRTRTSSVVSDFGGLSEVTAQTLAGLQREVAINTAAIARGTFAIYDVLRGGLPSPPSSLLAFAGGVSGSSTSSTTGGVVIGSITVNVGALNPGGLSPAEAGSAAGRTILNEIARLANAEVRFLGSGKRA